jgi:TonB family protein
MKHYLLLIFLLVIHPGPLNASDRAEQEGRDLIEQAESKTNIFALPSFEMKASVRVDNVDNKGKSLDGSYLLLWDGPERWREEISLPGYSEIQVGGKGVIFLKRNTDFIPLRVAQLHSALGYGYGEGSYPHHFFINVVPRPDETIKKIHGRKMNGSKVDCVEIVDHENRTRQVCVDETTGTLVRENPFLDSELMSVGGKLFPRFLSYVEYGKPLAEIHVTEFTTPRQIPSSAFNPPPGTVSKPGCMNPTPARLVKRVNPQYPEHERQSRIEGTVSIYGWIGKDGSVSEPRIISGVAPGLNDASLEAVRQWRYQPATCNGTPIDVEAVLTVMYQLR